jgi:isopenicillin-N N-acyltransferase-like protein
MLPVLTLEGSPYERGLTHGREARERIAHNIRVYFERFRREGKLALKETRRRAEAYREAIQAQNAQYAEEMRGVAEGSRFEIWEIAALNVRYELMYHQFSTNALSANPDGCTTIAVLSERSADGHLWLAENWDWVPEVKGLVLRLREGDLEVLSFTEAGIVGGKIGLNSRGLGLVINGLNTTDDDWARLEKPFHVRCYEILRSRTLEEAAAIVEEGERSCSANFLLAHRDEGALDLEAAPLGVHRLRPQDSLLIHTNHFLDPDALGVVEPLEEREERSIHRLRRSRELLGEKRPISREDLLQCLRDHDGYPFSVCRHPGEQDPPHERYQTVVSVMLDLHTRSMWISDGPPCESGYQELRLGVEA